jgi:hypothetical protein
MAKIVAIHGVGQQYKGEQELRSEWLSALQDGLTRAGRRLGEDHDLACAFYGDVFRPRGKTALAPPLDASDVSEAWEEEMLEAWWREAERTDSQLPQPDEQTKVRTPRSVQRALLALSNSKFFAGVAERALVFDLKQVYSYLHDPAIRQEVQRRVVEMVSEDTRVIVGHSLGSVVAYEAICAHPEWAVDTFVTLGSPLGIRNLIFDKLIPAPALDRGAWPASVKHWFNIADGGDVVALEKNLAVGFGDRVQDRLIYNGVTAHAVKRYLNVHETGEAIAAGL